MSQRPRRSASQDAKPSSSRSSRCQRDLQPTPRRSVKDMRVFASFDTGSGPSVFPNIPRCHAHKPMILPKPMIIPPSSRQASLNSNISTSTVKPKTSTVNPNPSDGRQGQIYSQLGSTGSNSSSPVPSLSSGYLSIYSQDHGVTAVPPPRRELVRHPSLPGDESWEDVWQLPDSISVRGYSDTDRDYYSSMAELDLDIPWQRHPLPPRRHIMEVQDRCPPQQRRVRHVYVQTVPQGHSGEFHQPLQLSGPSTWLRYGDTYEHIRIPELQTRDFRQFGQFQRVDLGVGGCCARSRSVTPSRVQFQEAEDDDGDRRDPSKIKNFFTWVSSKAGEHTSALLDAFPIKCNGKYVHVIMIGLDGAGKTTALYMMKLDQFLNTVPTIGFNCERVKGSVGSSAGTTFLVWDVGGQEKIRPLWKTYTRNTDGIIFMLDSADYRSFDQARIELHRTLGYQEKENDTPLLIMANKQDLPMALHERQVVNTLALRQLGRDQQWGVVLTCAKTGQGLDTGLEMLHMMIMKKKMKKKRLRNKTK